MKKTDKQLTEDAQRRVLTAYLDAFLSRYLNGDVGQAAVLDGRRHPVGRVAEVDVSTPAPGRLPPPLPPLGDDSRAS